MTPGWWRALFIVAVLAPTAEHEALACSCNGTGGPPCQAAWTADVVFAGTVRSVERIDHETLGAPYGSILVKFEVEQGFLKAVPGPLEIVTGMGGGDCGYRFTTGGRYLVYASKTPSSRLYTGICSRTRPLDKAAEDIRYLASVPTTGTGGRVYGRVHEWRRDPAEATAVDYGPIENVTVIVRGATFTREVTTDTQGTYQVPGLPVGEGTVSVIPPVGFDARYLERQFDLTDLRACSEMDFTISQIGSASGMVVDASGRPLADVDVEAVAAELAGFDPPPFQRPARTDNRGVFEFEDLPPGRYVFGVNLTKRPGTRPGGQPLFLPGTAVAREANVIELKPGDRLDIGVLRLVDR